MGAVVERDARLAQGEPVMAEIETMSHVALLDAYDESIPGQPDEAALRDEILRRMDSAGTSRRDEIAPHSPDHQR